MFLSPLMTCNVAEQGWGQRLNIICVWSIYFNQRHLCSRGIFFRVTYPPVLLHNAGTLGMPQLPSVLPWPAAARIGGPLTPASFTAAGGEAQQHRVCHIASTCEMLQKRRDVYGRARCVRRRYAVCTESPPRGIALQRRFLLQAVLQRLVGQGGTTVSPEAPSTGCGSGAGTGDDRPAMELPMTQKTFVYTHK